MKLKNAEMIKNMKNITRNYDRSIKDVKNYEASFEDN